MAIEPEASAKKFPKRGDIARSFLPAASLFPDFYAAENQPLKFGRGPEAAEFLERSDSIFRLGIFQKDRVKEGFNPRPIPPGGEGGEGFGWGFGMGKYLGRVM